MKTKNLIFCFAATTLLLSAFGNLNAQWQTSGSNIYNTNSGNIGIGITDPVWPMHMRRNVNGEISFVVENTYEGSAYGESTRTYLTAKPGQSMIQSTHDITFWTLSGAWSEKIVIKNNGNLGIGTANPTSKLTVAGDIRAREITVNANAGADFVFAPNYRLRPLDEVETFIKDNRHLPDIAPADDMVQNGVNMGEFQIQLLQKIEELTLYIIELEKRLSEIETK
ncbi:MAG: hypothetical protein LBV26_02340 [Bacteroidales bacterium]|jgi:hypothetical protein|nr:hypothetical protein [Bacteroidales bacterium]